MEGNPMEAINWLGVLVAAVYAFILGGLWYGPLFGKPWMRLTGMTEERAKSGSPAKVFGLAFVLEFLAAMALAMFIGPEASVAFGTFAGAMTGLFFVATAFGVVYLFERRSAAHWALDAGYQVLLFTGMGAILGAFAGGV